MGPFKPLPNARKSVVVARAGRNGRKPRSSGVTLQLGTGRNAVTSHLVELRLALSGKGVLGV